MSRSAPNSHARLARLYVLEGLLSLGATMMMVGIFFYTQSRFGWGSLRNLELCCDQGLVYVLGAYQPTRFPKNLADRKCSSPSMSRWRWSCAR